MGIANLRELAAIKPVEFDELEGTIVAVDALNWLYRYMSITVKYTESTDYTTNDGTEVPNLIGIIKGLPKFFEHDIFPIFIFDGESTQLKQKKLDKRRQRRRRAAKRAARARKRGEMRKAAHYKAQSVRLTVPISQTTHELLDLLDIPYIEAPDEAEAQAAYMARQRAVDSVVTDDYDALLYGSPLTIREFTSEGAPECMDFQATIEKHAITWKQLVEIAILCGTDYNQGVPGIGPKRALAEIKAYHDLETVLAQRSETIENAERIRDQFFNPTVTDAYDVERPISPDIDAARTYITETWEIPVNIVDRAFERLEKNQRIYG